ncbi:MAG TPA: THUMP domain-containing protein [Tenuifilaceae bacterium]|nr:THUMP domain-containing protein [Tenuifilaceae bacterium]HPE17358.1 THUMP domain-containing protein [Tenuifilaceae bacterium]HPJ45820.1 THUMP domain-containing protein [Tenuifilaceae bacterium]HPQ33536.1 THUMP domain-containing protein [Tenuifilaceae bacterium]HRX66832.1 THUMP domain-containing protein [Tenuifilaceae bacterium]
MAQKFEIIAKTFQGFETLLADELNELGFDDVQIQRRAVSFTGDNEALYRANFQTRTALRVLKPIFQFKARNEEELYGQAKKFDWTSVMDISHKFAVDSVVNSDVFTHSRYVGLKLKDAIVDHFRDKFGRRPFVDPKNPHIQIHIHISEQDCTILLDSSGESLHRRGYRTNQTLAPLNEVLAAGLIKLSGWDHQKPFVDPMCGSGTLLIEAALIARGIAPGIFRKQFGFENWLDFDKELFEAIFNDESKEKDVSPLIVGGDISKQAIETTLGNIRNAGLQKMIEVHPRSIFDFEPPAEKGIVITNPPYGERLRKDQIEVFYRQLGDCFKQKYNGYDIWLLSGNMDALKTFGLRPAVSKNVLNGAIECKYLKFPMYSGSKKAKFNKPEKRHQRLGR